MPGKYSANPEDVERYLERQLAAEDTGRLVSASKAKPGAKDGAYHLDKETVDLLNDDRIDTGG
jgi:hypothetical protein